VIVGVEHSLVSNVVGSGLVVSVNGCPPPWPKVEPVLAAADHGPDDG
jgi:hypothetical protein